MHVLYAESSTGEESEGGGSMGGWIAVATSLTTRHFSSTMLDISSPPSSATTLAFSFLFMFAFSFWPLAFLSAAFHPALILDMAFPFAIHANLMPMA